ncbi:tail fiber domain-containing protein [Pseudomonas sp. PDM20]|uniref:tail fiber domain-containing protein n=1 Tax=Pseudomonas sp. PDM20 TaxID=2769254 RepID=UPI00177F7FE0|nr:tail fiber domain-containing protein [Pseudomonas sp. PDM20]MBD9685247.1 tail fiber domain-containing protein [Pseudomonas sp. PDM20]
MPWYSAGTVAVTNNSSTVTGTGTSFSANARVGDAFRGPDGLWYEVTNVASATVISIKPNYQGANSAAGSYAIAPMQGYVKDSADALRGFVNQYGSLLASLGPLAVWQPGQTAVLDGGLSITGVGRRIIADFSNATQANRTIFQTSTVNGGTVVGAMPNGTANSAYFQCYGGNAGADNSSFMRMGSGAGDAILEAGAIGSGGQPPMRFITGGAERYRIDPAGIHYWGSYAANPISQKVNAMRYVPTSGVFLYEANTCPLSIGVSNGQVINFWYNGLNTIGSITTNGSATSYNTSSDYRLKDHVQPLDPAAATDRIMAYRPVTWIWKVDGSHGKGFIAHECQAVDPSTVTGTKDAVEQVGNILLADGSIVAEDVRQPVDLSAYGEGATWQMLAERPVYQGRDDSKMIPDMIAMLQRQEARITELETQLQQVLALLPSA